MANGFHGTKEEWQRLQQPLFDIDPVLEAFAAEYGVELLRNQRNWPDRAFRWGSPIGRIIQIYLHDEAGPTWNFWVCAWETRDDGQWTKKAALKEGVTMAELSDGLAELLRDAHTMVTGWTVGDLSRAKSG